MPFDRFFLPEIFSLNEKVEIRGEEFLHLNHVMRKKENDSIELVNGKGEIAEAVILNISKHHAEVFLTQVTKKPPLTPPITLIQAIPRLPALEWIIQKGTELGVSNFWLFPSQMSEKKDLTDSQMKRLRHISISALKQCGRLDLPEIRLFPSLDEIPISQGTSFFGDVRTSAPSFIGNVEQHSFFIGPEKGFTDEEINVLETEHKAIGVKLAPYILRTETAAITAIARFLLKK
jgi:16S rRNA (uracil1498-N3)-methyltransferase